MWKIRGARDDASNFGAARCPSHPSVLGVGRALLVELLMIGLLPLLAVSQTVTRSCSSCDAAKHAAYASCSCRQTSARVAATTSRATASLLRMTAAALPSAPCVRPTANAAPIMTRIIARRGGRLAAASTCTSARRALSHSLGRRRHRQSQHASIRTATPARRAASAYRRSIQPIQLARPFGAPTGSCSRATRSGRASYARPMASAARSR